MNYRWELFSRADGKTFTGKFDGTENDLWFQVSAHLVKSPVPNEMTVTIQNGQTAYMHVRQRGTWTDDDGNKHPSMFVVTDNGIVLPPSNYKKVFLTCILTEGNSYKSYELLPDNVRHVINARYGSHDDMVNGGGRHVKVPFQSFEYWIRYHEKISKKYVDESDMFYEKSTPVKRAKAAVASLSTTVSQFSHNFWADLASCSRQFVQSVCVMPPTKARVEECEKLIESLRHRRSVRLFNEDLKKILVLNPRKRNPLFDDVADFLAKSKDDFGKIIEREERLLLAMKPLVNNGGEEGSFEDHDIEVFEATPEQYKGVLSMLGPKLKGIARVNRVIRVKPKKQEKLFAEYCREHHISRKRKFWHGTKTENVLSIILESLKIHPNAAITGRMFGDGLYFAPSAMKSFGYTSFHGTRWAHGHSNRGFMLLFVTAYGEPYHPSTWGRRCQGDMERAGKDCVHALAGTTGLLNDEVVFYDERAVCLNYVVEFTAA